MAANRWGVSDPWREARQLQHEMASLFDSVFGKREQASPPCNVFAGEDDLLITCEVPGVSMEKLSICVIGDTLSIEGERKPEEVERSAYHRRERHTGPFRRSIHLPARVNADQVSAEYHDGVLNVTLPKAAEEKPRRIEIKAS
ncbi:MAG TPA: Hsp20/alpha crystallin family protein [Planctomycetota bacterium]|nr:Hsp20/alpha crystallin family protein [Planctomycetota bacterium]